MKIGLLNTRITLQVQKTVTDRVGNRKNLWTDYFSCAATISGEGGSEAEAAGLTVENTETDFTIRYSSETAPVTSTKYRVIYQGEVYNIIQVDHMNLKKKALKLRSRKERKT